MTYQLSPLRHPAPVSVRKARPGGAGSWGAAWPKVSIHLPICNAPPEIVRATLDALAALDYDRFEVLVIDSNTTDPQLWEPVAEHCARLGPKFRFFTLGRHQGFKAGALNFALGETAPDAELIGVIDSGDIVAPDWLRAMAPAFAEPKLGLAQSRQDDHDGSLFQRLMFGERAGFTLVRKQALLDAEGWAEWCSAAEAELSLRLLRAGYEAGRAEKSFGKNAMPDDFAAFRARRERGAYGAMRILRANADALFNPFNPELTPRQRWQLVAGWLPWIGDALGLVCLAMGLAWSAGLILGEAGFAFPIALFVLPSIGLLAFKVAQMFALSGRGGLRGRIGAAVAGLALSHSTAKAVWRGLLTNRPPAPVRGQAVARQEFWPLLLIWGALLWVGLFHHGATPATKLGCAVLFAQSLPYLAAVGVSLLARPSRRPKPAPAKASVRPPDRRSGGDRAGKEKNFAAQGRVAHLFLAARRSSRA
ncbi:glycosyltransferase [Acidocella sp.]|jgi:glycosyltransferase involved in cell wall biosynthesis|uniref:glycosyltransferase n=1 Tax=Acidocella sp. TaxID=50710 RepID=UPI002F3EF28E